ncbi:MAG: hypothetical protein OEV89_02105 [Desulfobulbaceae bacterium]|nr:hypothetical protein [Desulfobulbaceae bacterium]HIJ89636.1 hypothetical protein [Deltaproteobacteria bacterium]
MKNTIQKQAMGLGQLDQAAIGEGISQAGMGIILALATLIGAWGIACLIGGMSKMGGIMELGRCWLTAVTGM